MQGRESHRERRNEQRERGGGRDYKHKHFKDESVQTFDLFNKLLRKLVQFLDQPRSIPISLSSPYRVETRCTQLFELINIESRGVVFEERREGIDSFGRENEIGKRRWSRLHRRWRALLLRFHLFFHWLSDIASSRRGGSFSSVISLRRSCSVRRWDDRGRRDRS